MDYENEILSDKVIQLFLENNSDKWINRGKELIIKKGEYITIPEKVDNDVFIIKEGNACKFHIHIDGKECIIGLLGVGDFIGLMDVFTSKENREFVRALTDVTVVAVSKQEIRKFVEENPSVAAVLLNYISEKYLDMVEILEQIGYGTIKSRIVFLLKSLSNPQEDDNGWHPIPVSIAHKDIAGMIASTRETVTATLNKLSKEKVIRHQDGRLWIRMQKET